MHRHFRANPTEIPAYPLIVVDEYQDFSLLETKFIELLSTRSPVLIAGDDDQALYEWKNASPEFIRTLSSAGEFELFPLPYCSRCTEVIVSAVNDVILAATRRGNLQGRLAKEFECYLPDKQGDSTNNPKIISVVCSTARTNYAGRYICEQISRIPLVDIVGSRNDKRPTVLVIGPEPFLSSIFETIHQTFPDARMASSAKVEVSLLDGYRRIARNGRSRLGWRILVDRCTYRNYRRTVKKALEANSDLIDLIPEDYAANHRVIAEIVARLLDGDEITMEDETALIAATCLPIEDIRSKLGIDDDDEEEQNRDPVKNGDGNEVPDIVCTNLVGSKGLSAEHVFVVGLNNGHFPKDADAITDDEVCKFIVALSRTRKRCHLITFKYFVNGKPLSESIFLRWIRPHTNHVWVDKSYFDK